MKEQKSEPKTRKINVRDPEKFDYARSLYVNEGLTQKEIAERLDINPKTIKTWIDESGWREKRAVKNVSPDAMINRLMLIADELMNKEDFAENSTDNCNAIAKLIRQIKSLKNSTTNNDRIQTLIEFTDWLIIESRSDKEVNEILIKKINKLQDKFLMALTDAR